MGKLIDLLSFAARMMMIKNILPKCTMFQIVMKIITINLLVFSL